ncbi:ATP-binding protein [Deinococcus aquaticus]|uniref:ATP-binding protein n=1 Tax=Deinococcus aquaticus TaxID=328692 RepID=UPI003F47A4D1
MPVPPAHDTAASVFLSDHLQAVTEALATTQGQSAVLELVLTSAGQALGTVAGAVLLLDAASQSLTPFSAGPDASLWQGGPLEESGPVRDALARRESLFFADQGALLRSYPELEVRAAGAGAVATAVLPMTLDDQLSGALVVNVPAPHPFTEAEIRFLRILAAQCAVALDRAQLHQTLEDRVAARTAELEGERAALDAFVAYKESVGSESDVRILARQAVRVVQAGLQHVSAAYYELEDGWWKARVWSEDVAPEVAAEIQAGVPEDAPDFRDAARSQAAVFADGWNAEANELPSTDAYGAVALLPLTVNGETRSLFAVGTRDARAWNEREKALVRAVVRGLGITLERTEITRQLQARNAELDARTQALEAFAQLTQDLATQSDPYEFVRRAQEVTLSLLSPGYSLYYERDGNQWRNRVQVGDVGHADLQAFIDAGPPVGETPSIDVPWTTREPLYQDDYARGSDTPPEMVQHVQTVASLPVFRHGTVVGVLIAVLFDGRCWTPTDRVTLDTVVRSLGLALERAEQAGELRQRTEQLERSNAELEQFAYIASHDLQAPIRAVTSFAGIINRRYGAQLDERGQLYLRQIIDSGEHMKQLLDDLLTFSRVHTERHAFLPVDANVVFDTVAQRLQAGAPAAQVTRAALPTVRADALQLDQLLQNLISNGLKYRREGTVPQVRVSAQPDGPMWRFAVTDNGIGIESQYFGRIFEIFQRLHVRETYEGTGIGLAVCKKIVEQHGGQLWVDSTPGEGSTFYFTLPGVD